jgi:hypothetical protein
MKNLGQFIFIKYFRITSFEDSSHIFFKLNNLLLFQKRHKICLHQNEYTNENLIRSRSF